MAIAAAHSLADFAQRTLLKPDRILPLMTEMEVFAEVAEAVAQQAIEDNVARVKYNKGEIKNLTLQSIIQVRSTVDLIHSNGNIPHPSNEMLQDVLERVIKLF